MKTQEAIKILRDTGVLPESTAAAFLPAPRRKAALCRNHRGSAHTEQGPCTAPAYRVYEHIAGKWELRYNVCEKCLPLEAEFAHPDHTRIMEIN